MKTRLLVSLSNPQRIACVGEIYRRDFSVKPLGSLSASRFLRRPEFGGVVGSDGSALAAKLFYPVRTCRGNGA